MSSELSATDKLRRVTNYPELAESTYFKEYLARLSGGRDMHTIITAEGETGVGKTMVGFTLAYLLDVHGWSTEKATLDPREYANLYDRREYCDKHSGGDIDVQTFHSCPDCEYYLPKGSWILGDEWEQAMDTRLSMSKDNRELSHNYAGKRYRQLFSAVTLPSKNWLDKRLGQSSADYWIQCLEGDLGSVKGEARVYRLKEDEHYETSITKKTETLTWPNLEGHEMMQQLNLMKKQRFEGTETSTYIHKDEFQKAKKNFWNKATQKTRYEMIKAMYDFGIPQSDIAEITQLAEHIDGIQQPRVSQIVNSDDFEEVYSS